MEILAGWGWNNALAASMLAVIAALATRWGARPAWAHALWVLVLLKLVVPPVVEVPIPWFDPPARSEPAPEPLAAVATDEDLVLAWDQEIVFESVVDTRPIEAEIVPAPVSSPPDWGRMLVAAWLLGALVWLGLVGVQAWALHRTIRRGTSADPKTRRRVDQLAARMRLRKVPRVVLVPGTVSPMMVGSFGPAVLVLPRDLWDELDPDQRDALIIHELAHYKRRDHWVRLLEVAATALYWWLPTTWWARRRLRLAEEHCCDAWVVALRPGQAKAYATALMDTLDFLAGDRRGARVPLAASGMAQFDDLHGRISMILQGSNPRTLSWAGKLSVGALALALLPAGLTRADDPPKGDPKSADAQTQSVTEDVFILQNDDVTIATEPAKLVELFETNGFQPFGFTFATPKGQDDEEDDDAKEKDKQAKASADAESKERQVQIAKAKADLEKAQAELQRAAAALAKLQADDGIRRTFVYRVEAKAAAEAAKALAGQHKEEATAAAEAAKAFGEKVKQRREVIIQRNGDHVTARPLPPGEMPARVHVRALPRRLEAQEFRIPSLPNAAIRFQAQAQGQGDQDKRIRELEAKLEQVLVELKQMKGGKEEEEEEKSEGIELEIKLEDDGKKGDKEEDKDEGKDKDDNKPK